MSAAEKIDPIYIPVVQIAKVLGWPTWRARRWLKREGALIKLGDRSYYTTRDRLRAAFPEVLMAIDESDSLARDRATRSDRE